MVNDFNYHKLRNIICPRYLKDPVIPSMGKYSNFINADRIEYIEGIIFTQDRKLLKP